MSGVSLLGIGLTDGWKEALTLFTPTHGLLNVATPRSPAGGAVSMLIHGFLLGVLLGLLRSAPRILRSMFGNPRTRAMGFLLIAGAMALSATDAFADDGGIPEMLRGASLGPNLAVLLGTSAAAGIGLSTGIGVVTVIVNGVTQSRTAPPRRPQAPPPGRPVPGPPLGAPTSAPGRQGPPNYDGLIGGPGNDHQPLRPDEPEKEPPPNFTLSIRTDGGRTTIAADDTDTLRVTARVICDKPEINTSGMAKSITFDPSGPARAWLIEGPTSLAGDSAMIDLRAAPPTPEAELIDPGVTLTVRANIGRAVFSGVVELTIEPADYHIELIYDLD